MIKAIIVDDEYKSCENLKILINEYCKNVELVGLSQSISEAIKIIDAIHPEIVFLDVQMRMKRVLTC